MVLEHTAKHDVSNDDLGTRIARLSSGQLECLRLVDRHMSSKEIAAELGVSSHTVDQRLRVALQILGVDRRAQAARLVTEFSEQTATPVKALGAQTRDPPGHHSGPLPFPFATASSPRNRHSGAVKLLWVLFIALFAALSIGLYLAGLDSIAKYADKF